MSSQLTIWYISKYVTPSANARVGARGFFLLEELAKLGQRCVLISSDSNHLAETPTMEAPYADETFRGVQVRWIRTMNYRTARDWRRMLSWISFEWRVVRMPTRTLPKPDVVIASSLSILSILSGVYYRWRYRAKLIFEVRDIWPLVLVEEGGFSKWNPLVLFCGVIERFAYYAADDIVGTMPNLSPHVASVLGRSKPARCVPMGVDASAITEAMDVPEEYASAYLNHDGFTVCHAGTIGGTNALDTLFECARLMKDEDRVRFLIVGDGYMKAHYQALAADLKNVVFAPRVPKSMVQSILAKVDAVYFAAHPSRVLDYGQSLNKVVDYMLSARPVIASYSGFPSMIDEAQCGAYVPAGDATALKAEITRVLSLTTEERREMGARGRAWILANRRYSKLASDYLGILNELFDRGSLIGP